MHISNYHTTLYKSFILTQLELSLDSTEPDLL